MSTHDYSLANQNGANFRTDLNNALSAIVSNNSSATEPSTTYAYMWWADTANDKLKIRNSADSAWIDVMQISTGNPLFTGDLSLGDNDKIYLGDGNDLQIYHESSTNNSRIVESGTGNLNIEASNLNLKTPTGENYINCNENGAVDLRYDNATKLSTTSYGTKITGDLGIGVTPTRVPLHVHEPSTADCNIHLTNSNTGSTSGDGFTIFSNTTNCGFWGRENVSMLFATNGSERMRIDSTGNVIVGTTAVTDNNLIVKSANNSKSSVKFLSDASATVGWDTGYNGSSNLYYFTHTNGVNAMNIDASGNVLVGTTVSDPVSSNVAGISFEGAYGSGKFSRSGVAALDVNRISSDGEAVRFYKNGTKVGNISVTSSSTAYNTSSDYRLKENVVPMSGSIDRVKQLKPCNFNFIADATTTVDGFLAHEAQAVVPEAVSGDKDAMTTEEYEVTPAVEATYDEEGNELTPAVEAVMGTREVEDYQGIDQSKLVPLLTSALQEAVAKIEDLETRLAVLEGA